MNTDDKDVNASYEEIEEMIASDQTPVGIDAKKTHVIIIQKLLSLEKRLTQLEEQLPNKNKN